jgi:Rps23 Pro-64 3,4-dihydroxylase Tpa1-like proline 4-hydroxylase
MKLNNFIKIYDDILPIESIGNLIKYANFSNFKKAEVGNGEENFNIRRTYTHVLSNLSNEMSSVHWFNLLHFLFEKCLKKYREDLNLTDFAYAKIFDIEILKYEDSGFYTWHVDHYATVPRTMSCILLLNNDYEGGNLCFRNPDGSEEIEIEVKPGRVIIWPSNFLYPHTVKPVTKGKRYSVVAWAL